MYREYRKANGKIIRTFYYDYGRIVVVDPKTGVDIAECQFDPMSEEPSFVYDGEFFKVDDYLYDDIDTMISRVEKAQESKDRWAVRECELLSTFIKESSKIGVEMEVPVYDLIFPGIGVRGNSGSTVTTLMELYENRYTKDDWHYKIEFRVVDKNIRPYVGVESYYFSDFASMLLQGMFKLVNLSAVA